MLVHGVTHSAADLSARLLAQLKGNAETALGGRSVLSAVMGVPVNASPGMRAALTAAGASAGLQKIELLAEPVAAAIAALRELPEVTLALALALALTLALALALTLPPPQTPTPTPTPALSLALPLARALSLTLTLTRWRRCAPSACTRSAADPSLSRSYAGWRLGLTLALALLII